MKDKPQTQPDLNAIKAITLDLDDTLWPIWPAIRRAEEVLYEWLSEKAPAAAAMTSVDNLRVIRARAEQLHPEWSHDLSAYRREGIRMALAQAGDNEALAQEGFEVFFEARQRVDMFKDALPALERLSQKFPLVAVTNGNSNLNKVGIAQFFKTSISAQALGVGKPDVRIYEEAARHTKTQAMHEILHVGDDFHLDVVGATHAGFQTAWIVRPETANLQMEQLKKAPQGYNCNYQVANMLELCNLLNC